MQEGDADQDHDGTQRGGLGAGLDAVIGVRHAQHAEAGREQEQRPDDQEQVADDNRYIYLDVALVYGLLSFLGVLAVARFLEKGI